MSFGQRTRTRKIDLKNGDKILAVDPGGTTGIAQLVVGEGLAFELICSTELAWKDRFRIGEYIELMDWIVCERFTPYASKAQSLTNDTLPAVQMIGILEAYANMLHFIPDDIVYQMANETMNVKIIERHLPFLRGSEHRKDSYKHGRIFIVKNRHTSNASK